MLSADQKNTKLLEISLKKLQLYKLEKEATKEWGGTGEKPFRECASCRFIVLLLLCICVYVSYTLFQNGRHFSILLFSYKLALMTR